ncbi:hypothetical protein [Alkalihalobacillus sp. BA299]|nr:hypothetical protein [Alkalihalobacillus sp. BA299]
MSTKQELYKLVAYFESKLNRTLLEKEIEFLKWLQEKIAGSK